MSARELSRVTGLRRMPVSEWAAAADVVPEGERVEPDFDLSRSLDEARDRHLESVRLRLTRIRDEGAGLALSDVLHIVREGFAAGVSALADGLTVQDSLRQLAALDALEEEARSRAEVRRAFANSSQVGRSRHLCLYDAERGGFDGVTFDSL